MGQVGYVPRSVDVRGLIHGFISFFDRVPALVTITYLFGHTLVGVGSEDTVIRLPFLTSNINSPISFWMLVRLWERCASQGWKYFDET
jgi:hypothetical protein